jgi:hypothetical protein
MKFSMLSFTGTEKTRNKTHVFEIYGTFREMKKEWNMCLETEIVMYLRMHIENTERINVQFVQSLLEFREIRKYCHNR